MAAGLGFKTFTTGDVLTAGDTNGYLMQGVLVFASAAARTSAITSPQEGQYSYLKDTNSTEYYTGAAWVSASGGSAKSYSLLSTSTLTSGTSTTVSGLSGYDNLYVMFKNIRVTDTGNNTTKLQINSLTTGSNFYGSTVNVSTTFSTIVPVTDATAPFKLMDNGTVGNQDMNGYFYIEGANTAGVKIITQATFAAPNGATGAAGRIGTGTSTDSAVVSSLTISTTGTAFNAGTMYIYGAV